MQKYLLQAGVARGVCAPLQFSADLLTLSQLGAHYAPPDFQTLRRPGTVIIATIFGNAKLLSQSVVLLILDRGKNSDATLVKFTYCEKATKFEKISRHFFIT